MTCEGAWTSSERDPSAELLAAAASDAVQDLSEQFAAADGDMRELAVAITLSAGFHYLGGR